MTHWYEHAIIYQIYPKSFQDSNGDGIGDLNGIRRRIPYLQKLGVNTVWLNPVFVSPQVDNGYDVADYFAIDPAMGTMRDMEDLLRALHAAGIRVLLDLVLNHTSDQHPWFQAAVRNPASRYRDYYIFAGKNNVRPNNWGSFFGGSVWEPDPAQTGAFYFHLFDRRMPDLNWQNPAVRAEMLKVAEFWLAKGVDGLRLDAFIHIAKADLRQDFPTARGNDEPVVAEPFFANLPQVQEWLRPFCRQIKADYPDALLLGEAASANVNLAADYTAPNNHLLDSVITFRYFPEDDHGLDPRLPAQFQPKDLDWLAFKRIQAVWQQTLADVSLPVLYWNNHDMPRLATARAKTPTQARSLAMLMYLQRGLPIIYYGEELGLKNLLFTSADQFHDEAAGDFIKRAQVLGKSRDETLQMVSSAHKLPARGPMPWTSEPGGGFSTGRPWLTGERLDRANVEDELNDPGSTLNFYRRLLALKKRALFQTERFYLRATGPDSYVYQRDLGGASVIVAVALGDKETKVRIPRGYTQEELVAGRYRLEDGELLLSPFAGVVLSKES